MDSMIRPTLERNLLRYAVQRAIFCGCGSILDYRKAVLVTHGATNAVLCRPCWEKCLKGWEAKRPLADVAELLGPDGVIYGARIPKTSRLPEVSR